MISQNNTVSVECSTSNGCITTYYTRQEPDQHPFLIGGGLLILVLLGLAMVAGLRSEINGQRVKTSLVEFSKVFLISALVTGVIELTFLLTTVFGS